MCPESIFLYRSSPPLSLSCLGQIAANEALKKDLEGVISGLQEYLGTVKGQAAQAQSECRRLQDEKEVLLQRLTEVEQERDQLEIVALDAENMRKVWFVSSCLLSLASEVDGAQMKLRTLATLRLEVAEAAVAVLCFGLFSPLWCAGNDFFYFTKKRKIILAEFLSLKSTVLK